MLIDLQLDPLLQREMEKHAKRKKLTLSQVVAKCLESYKLGNLMRERAVLREHELEILRVETNSLKSALIRNFKEVRDIVSVKHCRKIMKPTLLELNQYGKYPSWMYGYYFKGLKRVVKMIGT